MSIRFHAAKDAPIACTMPIREMGGRIRAFHELFSSHLRSSTRESRRLRLDLDPAIGLEARVRDLMAQEHACCAFADIAIQSDPAGLSVEISVPPGAEGALDGFAFLAGVADPGSTR